MVMKKYKFETKPSWPHTKITYRGDMNWVKNIFLFICVLLCKVATSPWASLYGYSWIMGWEKTFYDFLSVRTVLSNSIINSCCQTTPFSSWEHLLESRTSKRHTDSQLTESQPIIVFLLTSNAQFHLPCSSCHFQMVHKKGCFWSAHANLTWATFYYCLFQKITKFARHHAPVSNRNST